VPKAMNVCGSIVGGHFRRRKISFQNTGGIPFIFFIEINKFRCVPIFGQVPFLWPFFEFNFLDFLEYYLTSFEVKFDQTGFFKIPIFPV